MKLKDIKDVLTFAAFRPEPDDGSTPWTRRFPKRNTLLLNIGKNRTSWRCLTRSGSIADGGMQRGEFKDIAASQAADWRKLADNGWCNVSINSRYVISLESNLPRKEGIEDIMRTNPRAVLGGKFERTKRYALTNNPERGTSIVLSCEEEVIKKIEAILVENGLRAGRICCGTYAMLRRLIEYANPGDQKGQADSINHIYIVCCEGSVCVLNQSGDVWSDLRSRSDSYEEDTSPILEIVASAHHADDQHPTEILFIADHAGSDLPEKLAAQHPELKVTDLTQPEHLWAVISDLH